MHSVVCSVFRSLFFREIFCHFPDQRIARKLRLRLGASQSTIITLFPIRPLGKVNQISTNPRHFPPMIHTLQVLQEVYTGELPKNHRESEPNSHESWALSPWGLSLTYKIPIVNTSIGLVPFHGSIFVSDKATSRTKRCKISWGKKENRILSAYFPPHVHLTKLDNIDNQWVVKTRSGFGYFSTYPSAGCLLASY